ncbi:MAG: outer membrane protein transport protein [Burkholderiaceae bacterium]
MKKCQLVSQAPRAVAALIAGLFVAAPAAHAAGFQLSEQSVVSTGRAHAGAGVVGDDLSAVFYNPAGMSLLKGTSAQFGLSYISLDAPFQNSITGATDNGRDKPAVVPNTFLVHSLNEQVTLGLGITTPFGLASSYGEEWSGRAKGISSSIMTIDINPSVAYKLNEMWSFGLGVSAQYQKAKLKKGAAPAGTPGLGNASGELEADDWAFGYNLGVMFSPSADLRIGLSYRSKLDHDAEGDYTFTGGSQGFARLPNGTLVPVNYGVWNGTYNGSASVTTPDTFLLSAFGRINPQWSLTGSVRHSNWTTYDVLEIKNASPVRPGIGAIPSTVIDNQWKATWMVAAGADFQYTPRTTFRAGIGYETSPVPSAQLRSPLIPDTSRLWLSLGASYRIDDKTTVDFAYAHLRGTGDKTIDSVDAKTGVLKGEYQSLDAFILGAQLQYRF